MSEFLHLLGNIFILQTMQQTWWTSRNRVCVCACVHVRVCVCMHMCMMCEEYSLIYILFLRFYVYILLTLLCWWSELHVKSKKRPGLHGYVCSATWRACAQLQPSQRASPVLRTHLYFLTWWVAHCWFLFPPALFTLLFLIIYIPFPACLCSSSSSLFTFFPTSFLLSSSSCLQSASSLFTFFLFLVYVPLPPCLHCSSSFTFLFLII